MFPRCGFNDLAALRQDRAACIFFFVDVKITLKDQI